MKADARSTEMTVAEIIQELTPYTGRFPKRALQAAIAQREAITPHLLTALEEVADAPERFATRGDYMLHTYALYLLAQFREKRAYPLAINLVMAPGDLPDDLLGDTITQGLQNIPGSIYNGDPVPLQRLVEGEEINEWVRGTAVDVFLVLVHTGQMPRDEACRYFRSLFEGGLRREHQQVWNELTCAVSDLPAPDLLELLRQAYDEGLVDPGYADYDGIERDARDGSRAGSPHLLKQYALIDDAICEMEWWAAFRNDEDSRPLRKAITGGAALTDHRDFSKDRDPEAPTPAPKVGRNDPCPCGSGVKYKRCCLGKE